MRIFIYRLDTSKDDVQLNVVFPLFLEKMQMEEEIVCIPNVIASEQLFTQKTIFKTKPFDCHILFLAGLNDFASIEQVKMLESAPLVFWLGDRAPALTSLSVLPDACVLPAWEITQEFEKSLSDKCKLLRIDNFCHQVTSSLFSQQMQTTSEYKNFLEGLSDRVVIAIEIDDKICNLQTLDFSDLAKRMIARILKREVALQRCVFVLSAPIQNLSFLDNSLNSYWGLWDYKLGAIELLISEIVNQLREHGIDWQNQLMIVDNQEHMQISSLIDIANLGEQSIFFIPSWQDAVIECVGRLNESSDLVCYGDDICSSFSLSLLKAGYMTKLDAVDVQQTGLCLRSGKNSAELNPTAFITSSFIEVSLDLHILNRQKMLEVAAHCLSDLPSEVDKNLTPCLPAFFQRKRIKMGSDAATRKSTEAERKAKEIIQVSVSMVDGRSSWSGFFSLMATTALLSAIAVCVLPNIKNGSLKNFRPFR